MSRLSLIRILALVGLCAAAASAGAQRNIYCWYDDNGVRHCGDRVPPEHARHDRSIINAQGVVVGSEEGEITDDERREIEAAARAEQEKLDAAERQLQFDQFLLDSYLSVAAIENVRDRNVEVFDSRARILEIYLRNHKKRLGDLLETAERYAPYNRDEDAPPMPVNLANDIANTESSIRVREQTLEETLRNRQRIEDDFNAQIARFREITR